MIVQEITQSTNNPHKHEKDAQLEETVNKDEKPSSGVTGVDLCLEKTKLVTDNRRDIVLRMFWLVVFEIAFLITMGIAGMVATIFRSYFLNGSIRIVNCCIQFLLMLIQFPVLNVLGWWLKLNIMSSHSSFPVGQASQEYKAIMKHILRDPILSFGYIAIITCTLWLAFICPVDFFDSKYINIIALAFFLLNKINGKVTENIPFFSFNYSSSASSNVSRGEYDSSSDETEEQAADLENLEQLLEHTASGEKVIKGEQNGVEFGSVIEKYEAKVRQRMKKYKIFQFVFPTITMVIHATRTFWSASNKIGSYEKYAFILDEVLISTSFFLLKRLNMKRQHIMLIEYVKEYLPIMKNKRRYSKEVSNRRMDLVYVYYLTIYWVLFFSFFVNRAPFECVVNVCLVLFLIFRTNKVTTGSYLSFKSKPKAMKNRV
ncbi:hypothetical protein CORT_0A11950 [Candida orthopsilosis Co 90-125]|uniref:Uncharacterized protein n=1 Tax=Candida orthopsilosis (strain 90-125) TaxID=1136231 RepID=H8WYU8_CANO9|nr:hypothetical protein CORT_0A11950 [Candida orthopsilosis Co 90-125]CCG21580.1 hypothetical protein CORT_0A11950 [Candida orthopsilosis Co 90-125]